MFDLTSLIPLIAAAIFGAIWKIRRDVARSTTHKLEKKDTSHAQDIANDVANSRADRRRADAGNGPDGVPMVDPKDKRGWRD